MYGVIRNRPIASLFPVGSFFSYSEEYCKRIIACFKKNIQFVWWEGIGWRRKEEKKNEQTFPSLALKTSVLDCIRKERKWWEENRMIFPIFFSPKLEEFERKNRKAFFFWFLTPNQPLDFSCFLFPSLPFFSFPTFTIKTPNKLWGMHDDPYLWWRWQIYLLKQSLTYLLSSMTEWFFFYHCSNKFCYEDPSQCPSSKTYKA